MEASHMSRTGWRHCIAITFRVDAIVPDIEVLQCAVRCHHLQDPARTISNVVVVIIVALSRSTSTASSCRTLTQLLQQQTTLETDLNATTTQWHNPAGGREHEHTKPQRHISVMWWALPIYLTPI